MYKSDEMSSSMLMYKSFTFNSPQFYASSLPLDIFDSLPIVQFAKRNSN